jgi:NADH-quinone oxidoreductase subunit M
MILQGTFADPELRMYAIIAVLGIVLGAAYMLWLYQRVMFGPLDKPENQAMKDLNLRELATYIPLIILAFWIGLYPKTFLQYLDQPVNQIVERVRGKEYSQRAQMPVLPAPAVRVSADARQ